MADPTVNHEGRNVRTTEPLAYRYLNGEIRTMPVGTLAHVECMDDAPDTYILLVEDGPYINELPSVSPVQFEVLTESP